MDRKIRLQTSETTQLGQSAAEATVLLSDRAEVASAGLNRSGPVPIIFSEKVKKAHEYLAGKGVAVGPLQNDGNSDFFEVRDPEGNVIEICQES